MNTNHIHYDANGQSNTGLYHRALMVARALFEAHLWDGEALITICNPDALQRQLDLYGQPVTALRPSVDYIIK